MIQGLYESGDVFTQLYSLNATHDCMNQGLYSLNDTDCIHSMPLYSLNATVFTQCHCIHSMPLYSLNATVFTHFTPCYSPVCERLLLMLPPSPTDSDAPSNWLNLVLSSRNALLRPWCHQFQYQTRVRAPSYSPPASFASIASALVGRGPREAREARGIQKSVSVWALDG
jgi:hypothetical protein